MSLAVQFNSFQGQALSVPMHKIPNIPLGKVANRSVVRVFFPRMYHRFNSNKIPAVDMDLIYNRCLLPTIRHLMPNQATHWPADYAIALETSRDIVGHLHLGTVDISPHLLVDFASQYLETLQALRPYFREAYFGHELRGWKAATVHNIEDQNQPNQEQDPAYERVQALGDLTRILHMPSIQPDQWLIDIGLEFGIPGRVVTWRSIGHAALIKHLIPTLRNAEQVAANRNIFFIDNQMHLKDIAGFRWSPGNRSNTISYIQAYTTEKTVAYQLHEGIFRPRKPMELLSGRTIVKLIDDLDAQSGILFGCTGDNPNHPDARPQEGCARLEIRVPLANANDILRSYPHELIDQTLIQIPARHWW